MEKFFYVDVPKASFDRETGNDSWENVTTFNSFEEAVRFCQEFYGSDELGRVKLITEGG